MSVYEPNSRHLREVLIFCFNMKKSAPEVYRMLSNIYGEAAISEMHEYCLSPKSDEEKKIQNSHALYGRKIGYAYTGDFISTIVLNIIVKCPSIFSTSMFSIPE
ncbi:hypothetical protein ALC62_10940 [Cyphomyrmex costatus]|uniref:Mos1 transposase HTH domain-containing protein n=1 Tax=Cyphomyrmex costatus TaxID=456900 RepID=A0A151ID71_9HYME|nr:hypothetical protein ALC62_10940 [Cyphomyrmex costatus]